MTRQKPSVTTRSRCDEEYHFYPKLLLEQTLVFIYLISQRYFVQIMPSVSNCKTVLVYVLDSSTILRLGLIGK